MSFWVRKCLDFSMPAASTIRNALYELAFDQNIQNKLRKEIQDMYMKNNGELQYESINSMPYLNAVFKGKYINA